VLVDVEGQDDVNFLIRGERWRNRRRDKMHELGRAIERGLSGSVRRGGRSR
jgi:hypothetical protein